MFQFSNIANIYFLFVIILGAWSIFGVQNPGMQAVPLIVVVALTAIKDAFEDNRRAASDLEMNASRIHVIVGPHNPNVIVDNVSLWRRFKKACTRMMRKSIRAMNPKKDKGVDVTELQEEDVVDTFSLTSPRKSMATQRRSIASRPAAKISPFVPNTVSNPNITPEMTYKFRNNFWKNVNVGDIIRVRNNEEVPSDAVILSTSDPDGFN
ncbi:unnamed protein product [Ambrosiozyma monospora]|uniref:Unnamed protein product n=1 Tax=Ambrosiozyma monospora TaxID=43982 RepID=A0ACB5UCG1_AMBMO|nr:unnamed protein product [Ambrosiozyma monospora]